MIHHVLRYSLWISALACVITLSSSCEHVDDTPEINLGYRTTVRLPDPEFLTDEDREIIEAMEIEYDLNAK